MTTPVDWPTILKPTDFGYSLVDVDVSGGQAIGSGEQFIASAGPRWSASMTLAIRNDEQALALRALSVQLKGRAVPVKLPNFDGRRLSWPPYLTSDGKPTGVLLHPGNTRNPILDDTVYEDPPIPASSEIIAAVNVNAALRATSVAIKVTQGGDIVPGQQFGIGDCLYEIGTVLATIGPPPVYTCTILPPLRAAAASLTPVKFTRPYALMRCMNLAEEFRRLDLLRFANLTLEFAEFF